MENIEKLDDMLYKAMYGIPKTGDSEIIWEQIKENQAVLREAIKIKKDKWNEKDIVSGLTISNAMLIDYKDVNQEIYNELINSIYSNTDIARIVMNGCSFLLMSLWNHNLKLTEEQKAFAVNEAMNKFGTTKHNTYDSQVATMSYFHGVGPFDIRYHILRNPNWTLDEKQELVMDFYSDDNDYDDCLEQWELGIVNDFSYYKGLELPTNDEYELLNEYSYEMLLKYYGSEDIVDRIWSEIQFCKQMHQLRPMQYEKKFSKQKVLG